MPDIRYVAVSRPDIVTFDWLQQPTGLLDETDQLASAIILALNSDALADDSDALPDPRDSNLRGWWGDIDAKKLWNGWPLGSKLWLLTRAKIVDAGAAEGATVARVEAYIRAALKPFVDNGVFTRFDVSVSQVSDQRISATIMIYRGQKPAIKLEYQPLWLELFPGS
ncbi:phage GP46 family protein [Bradyrhizobium sp. S3.7.6]